MSHKSSYIDELKSIFLNRTFLICVIAIAVIAYGFAACNITVGIDDLEGDRYVGSGMAMLQAGRFTMYLISLLFGYGSRVMEHAYVIDILAVCGLIWSSVNFCILFRRICKDAVSIDACTVFTCILVSYPLHNEIWEYTGANLCVSFGFVCVSLALLCMHRVVHQQEKSNLKYVIGASVFLMLVCSGYESLVTVYIFFVFAVLALQVVYGTQQEKKVKTIFLQGLCYAAALAAGLILRILVHQIILQIIQLPAETNGATVIQWGLRPAGEIVWDLLLDWYKKYLLHAIIYFPLTEAAVAAAVLFVLGIAAGKKHGWSILLPGAGMFLTPFLLGLLQGTMSPYRTCQVFAVLTALASLMVILLSNSWKNARKKTVLLVLCGYLCFCQANQLNYYLTLNHMRSDEEAFVIRTIASDLHSSYSQEKPVVFVGDYELSPYIQEASSIPETSLRWRVYRRICLSSEQISWEIFNTDNLSRKLPDSDINSAITWGVSAYRQEGIQKLFSYYGYEYVLGGECYGEAKEYAQATNMPAYPKDGYIQDTGRFIVVNLG